MSNITQGESYNYIRNNLIVVENDVEVFPEGGRDWVFPKSVISNNLYFAAAGNLNMGLAGPGENPIFPDPQIENYSSLDDPGAFTLKPSSPAIDAGLDLGYSADVFDTAIPQKSSADIGAFEYQCSNSSADNDEDGLLHANEQRDLDSEKPGRSEPF